MESQFGILSVKSIFFFHWFQTQSTMFALSTAFLLFVAHTRDLILME